MKIWKDISGTLFILSLLFLIGVAGALELDKINFSEFINQGAVGLVFMAVSGLGTGIVVTKSEKKTPTRSGNSKGGKTKH